MRNPKNVLNSLSKHSGNSNYKFERLYRVLFNAEMFYVAYERIYAKPGNMTAGTDGKTVSGMSIERIEHIKMAKEQNLSLNPTKISGVCGRLMCCLKNEEETYEDLNSKLPNVGDYVTTDDGLKGEVHSVSVLRQLVKVIVITKDEKEIREYRVDQLKFKPRRRKDKGSVADAELKALEALEKKEGKSKLDDN